MSSIVLISRLLILLLLLLSRHIGIALILVLLLLGVEIAIAGTGGCIVVLIVHHRLDVDVVAGADTTHVRLAVVI